MRRKLHETAIEEVWIILFDLQLKRMFIHSEQLLVMHLKT